MSRLFVFVYGVFSISWQVGNSESNKYENHTLLRLYPKTNDQMGALVEFKDPNGEVEILKGSRGFNDSMDVLVPPTRMDFVTDFVRRTNLDMVDIMENYGRKFEEVESRSGRRMRNENLYEYHSYQEIQDMLEALASRLPNKVTLQTLGHSYQQKPMKLVKISNNLEAGNPIIFVDAGAHAREWAAPAMALYLISRLANDPAATKNELKGIDWYILPVVNPDGYEYSRSHAQHRMWRKTRSKNGDCFGVDPNRNYGYKWATSGVSHNPCDKETFAGPRPFSEPESRSVSAIMRANKHRIKLYVSLHSYGQYLVYPWGYTADLLPPTWKKMDSLARAVSDSVQNAGGEPFKVLSAGQWYAAAGGSDDYAFSLGIPYSYTMEITNGHEFIFPERMLKNVLPQVYQGFKTFAVHIRNEFPVKNYHRNP